MLPSKSSREVRASLANGSLWVRAVLRYQDSGFGVAGFRLWGFGGYGLGCWVSVFRGFRGLGFRARVKDIRGQSD